MCFTGGPEWDPCPAWEVGPLLGRPKVPDGISLILPGILSGRQDPRKYNHDSQVGQMGSRLSCPLSRVGAGISGGITMRPRWNRWDPICLAFNPRGEAG